jgi:hypothetical protein
VCGFWIEQNPTHLSFDDLVHSNAGSFFPRAGLNPVYAMVLPLLLSFFGFPFPPDQASSATLTFGVKSPICSDFASSLG